MSALCRHVSSLLQSSSIDLSDNFKPLYSVFVFTFVEQFWLLVTFFYENDDRKWWQKGSNYTVNNQSSPSRSPGLPEVGEHRSPTFRLDLSTDCGEQRCTPCLKNCASVIFE